MKIIKEIQSNRVIYFLNDDDEVLLTESSLSGTYTNLAVNNIDFELIENLSVCQFDNKFGEIGYENNLFFIIDQSSYDIEKDKFESKNIILGIKNKILAIENSITPRRTREAILGTDNGWLAEQEAAIALLRQQLAEYDNAI